jgi:hypothetical protein
MRALQPPRPPSRQSPRQDQPTRRSASLRPTEQAWARLPETENRTDDYETLEEAGRAVDDALREIMKTPPTTRAGARAVIEHLVEWDEDGSTETHHYLATLLRSPVLAG